MTIDELPLGEYGQFIRIWNFARTKQGTITAVYLPPEDRYPSFDVEWDDGTKSERGFIQGCKCDLVTTSENHKGFGATIKDVCGVRT